MRDYPISCKKGETGDSQFAAKNANIY
jgi:hypothetical protein